MRPGIFLFPFYRSNNLFFNPGTGELMRADLVRERLAGDSIINWMSAICVLSLRKTSETLKKTQTVSSARILPAVKT